MRSRFWGSVVALTMAACGSVGVMPDASTDAPACTSGEVEACTGPSGCTGTRTCSNGTFSSCRCSYDAGTDADMSDAGCQPDMTPFAPKWVPPNMLSSCTPSLVDAAWAACGPPNQMSQQCNQFTAANAACVACLFTAFGSSSHYGPVMTWNNGGSMKTNTAGCISIIDNDSSASSCAAKVQAYVACGINACLVCPGQYLACSAIANTTVCKSFAAGAQCENNAKYSSCNYATLDAAFKGLGRLYCAGGSSDGGSD